MFLQTSEGMVVNSDAIAYLYVDTIGQHVTARLRDLAPDPAEKPEERLCELIVIHEGGQEALDWLFVQLLDDRAPTTIDCREHE